MALQPCLRGSSVVLGLDVYSCHYLFLIHVLQMEACPFTPPNHTSYYMTAQALLKAGRHGLAAEVAQRGIQQRGDKSAALKHLVAELSRTLLSGSSKSTANEIGHHGGNRFMQATGKGMAVV